MYMKKNNKKKRTNKQFLLTTISPPLVRFTFVSGAADNIKQWYLPRGEFIQNLGGHTAIINTMVASASGVLVSGSDTGSLCFWDYRTGYRFQTLDSIPQPGIT